jgi:hypothetical protein
VQLAPARRAANSCRCAPCRCAGCPHSRPAQFTLALFSQETNEGQCSSNQILNVRAPGARHPTVRRSTPGNALADSRHQFWPTALVHPTIKTTPTAPFASHTGRHGGDYIEARNGFVRRDPPVALPVNANEHVALRQVRTIEIPRRVWARTRLEHYWCEANTLDRLPGSPALTC